MQVILHCADGDAQAVRDSLVAESPCYEARNFELTMRKSHEPRIRYLIGRNGRYPEDDQGIAEIARGLEINRHAWANASIGCQVEQFLDRQRPSS